MNSKKQNTVASVMLMILGYELDPDLVTQMLGLAPSQTWYKGENHKRTRPDGTVEVYDTTYPWSGWKLWLSGELREMTLEAQLNHWLRILSEHCADTKKLKAQGNEIIIHCYLATESYLVYLPAELQAKISELGVDLEFSISNLHGPTARERRRMLRRRIRGR